MTDQTTGRTVRLSVRDWCGLVTITVLMLGILWNFSSRLTAIEKGIESNAIKNAEQDRRIEKLDGKIDTIWGTR